MKKLFAMTLLLALTLPVLAQEPYLSQASKDIVKMSQSQVDSKVVEAYVQNSSTPFSPTADEIIYLHKEGVSDSVIAAALKRGAELRPQAAVRGPEVSSNVQAAPGSVIYSPASNPMVVAPTYVYDPPVASSYVYSYPVYPSFSIGFGCPIRFSSSYGYYGYGSRYPYYGYGYGSYGYRYPYYRGGSSISVGLNFGHHSSFGFGHRFH
jgi:hypothetical protein